MFQGEKEKAREEEPMSSNRWRGMCISVDLVAGCIQQSRHADSVGSLASCGNHKQNPCRCCCFMEVQIYTETRVN